MSSESVDTALLEKFEQEIWSKIPHLQGDKVENATPLVDLTEDLKECSKSIYKFDLSNEDLKVYGKFDADLVSGSIKVRPAVHIIHDAIKTGKLKKRTNNYRSHIRKLWNCTRSNVKIRINCCFTCFKKITRRSIQRAKK